MFLNSDLFTCNSFFLAVFSKAVPAKEKEGNNSNDFSYSNGIPSFSRTSQVNFSNGDLVLDTLFAIRFLLRSKDNIRKSP